MKAFFKRRASTQSSPIEDPPAVPLYTLPGSNKSPKPRLSSTRVPPPKVRSSMLEDVDTSRKHQSTPVLYISSPITECAPCADVELQLEPVPQGTLGLLGDFRSSMIMASFFSHEP